MATLNSKYNLGDTVYHVTYSTPQYYEKCLCCVGTGKIQAGPETFNCPKCYGRGNMCKYKPKAFYISLGSMTIGQVRISSTDPQTAKKHKYAPQVVEYMTHEYGIYSGTIFKEEDLFPNIKDAQQECDKRNLAEDRKKEG